MQIENRIVEFEPQIARMLAALCYHIHPDIVAYIQHANLRDRPFFEELLEGRIEINSYLFDGSACVFPGVRRYVSGRGRTRSYSPSEGAILDSNEFPRHLWCFLLRGKSYGGLVWKDTGLADFELAHVFSHKPSETQPEEGLFRELSDDIPPFGNFTCAANVTLLPKGTVRPTDNSVVIKSVFFKRHIDLYGESTLRSRHAFREDLLPVWYDAINWNAPLLPTDWKENTKNLLEYRSNKIAGIMTKRDTSWAA